MSGRYGTVVGGTGDVNKGNRDRVMGMRRSA